MRDDFLTEAQIGAKRASYKRRTKMEKWGGKTTWYDQLKPMSRKAVYDMYKEVKRQTERRVKSLASKKADSYAAFKLQEELKGTKVSKNSNKQKISAILSIYHDFWSSLTSTISGARAVNKEQDIRLFGAIGKGAAARPAYSMSSDERTELWAAYMEFYHQYKSDVTKYDSNRIQRIIGEAFKYMTADEIKSRLKLIHKAAEEDYDLESAKTATERKGSSVEQAAEIYRKIYKDYRERGILDDTE